MHPHTEKFGVRVSGVRQAAPCGPSPADGMAFWRKSGIMLPIGGADPTATDESINDLRNALLEAVKPAQDVVAKAEAEKRQLTDEEKAIVRKSLEDAKPIEKKIVDWRDDEDARKSLRDLTHGIETPTKSGQPRTAGAEFVESDAYKSLMKRGLAQKWTTGPIELKATLTQDAASGGKLVEVDLQPGVLPLLFRRLTVADLMPNGTTDSNTVRYLKETTATNAAATVAEGAAKPESTLAFDLVDEPVRKIATFLPVSDEMLEDVAQIRSYIDNRLRLFIQLTEEDQLLNGNGTAPNLTGILNRSGIQTIARGTDTRGDAVFKAITEVRRDALLEPDGIVIHPTDWQEAKLEKDANNQYYGGGPFTGPYGQNGIYEDRYWGLRVVVTPAIAENTVLVGAFAASAQVFRRGGLTVEASNSHSDFFQKNLTAIRAEERLGLAVYRPAGFCTITGM